MFILLLVIRFALTVRKLERLKNHSRIGLFTLNALAIDEPLEYAQLYLDGFSFHLTAPYSEERREAAWEYARERDAADRLK